MTSGVQWRIKGELISACNCDWGCPCNFNARPTYERCQGTYIWRIQEGRYGEVALDGLFMSWAAESPGPIHEGHVIVQFIVDARADDVQRDALLKLMKGEAGGMFGILATVTETTLDPIYAAFEGSINGLESYINVPGVLEIGVTPIKNPVTGNLEELQLMKPTGFTSKVSNLGASTVYRFTGGFQDDHSGKYAEHAPFEYNGP